MLPYFHGVSDAFMERYNKGKPFPASQWEYFFEGLKHRRNYLRFYFETEEMLETFQNRVESWEMRNKMREMYKKMDEETKSKLDGPIREYLQKCPHCKIEIFQFYICHHIPEEDVDKLYDLICTMPPLLGEKQEAVTSKSERIASILHGVVKLLDKNDQTYIYHVTLALLCGMVGCDMPHSLVDCTAKIITLPPNKLAMLENIVVTANPESLLLQLFQKSNKITIDQWYVLAGLVGEKKKNLSGPVEIYHRIAQRLTEMEDTSILEAFLKKIE